MRNPGSAPDWADRMDVGAGWTWPHVIFASLVQLFLRASE